MSQMELPDRVSPNLGAGLPLPFPDAASALSAFVARAPFGVAVIDTELRFLVVSPGLAALQGQDASRTVGRRVEDVLPAPYGDAVARRLRAVLASGAPIVDPRPWGTFSGPHSERSYTSSYYRLDNASGTTLGVVMLVTETTELRTALTAAKAAGAQLELLQKITEALSERGTIADVTQAALTGAVRAVDASAAVLMAQGPGDELVPLASTGLEDSTLGRLQQPVSLGAHLPHCDALRSRTIVHWGSRAERDLEYPELGRYSGDHQAWAFVPILSRDGGIGVVMFAWRLDREFTESDISLFAAVGRQCALALEQIRTLEAEREARRATEFLVEVTKFVVEGSDEGVYAMSAGNRILTFNRRFCELIGLSETAIHVGADAKSLLAHWLSVAADPEAMSQHLTDARERPFDQLAVDFEPKDGGVIACVSAPIVDRHNVALGRVWYLRDETQRRAQEAEQRVALEQLRASHQHQAFLLQAAEIVSRGDGYVDTLQRLAAVAVPTLADLCLVDTLTWDGRIVRMAARHADPALQPLCDELGAKYAPDPDGAHPSVEVMQTGRVRWSATMSEEFLRKTSRDDSHFALLTLLGFTSYVALPLIADNRVLGEGGLV